MAISLPGVGVSLIDSAGAASPGVMGALFALSGADMTSTADQAFKPLFPFKTYMISSITVTQASGSLSGALGGIYTGAGKTGSIIVPASQAYAGVTGSSSVFSLTISATGTALQTSQSLFLSLTTALGAAGTANFYIIGMAL